MSDLEIIKNRLKEFGFFPEFSNKSKYLTKIRSYLGIKESNNLLNNIDFILGTSNAEDAENEIANLIGNDNILLKIIYSTGIETSAVIFNSMLNILDTTTINPKIIADLGGSNGWSLELLEEYFENNSRLLLIEQNKTWGRVNERIICIYENYDNVSVDIKVDFAISIFGISAYDSEPLLKCASNILSNDGYLLLSLRIPDDSTFLKFQIIAKSNGFGIVKDFSRRIIYQNQSSKRTEIFPLLMLTKSIKNSETFKIKDLKLE